MSKDENTKKASEKLRSILAGNFDSDVHLVITYHKNLLNCEPGKFIKK